MTAAKDTHLAGAITPAMAVEITPKMAEQMLSKANHSNRKLNHNHVSAFKRTIDRGEFMVTHQGIAFDRFGNLIDGQHRLHAIVETGIAQRMFVFHGLDSHAMLVMDIGKNRSVLDRLTLDGHAGLTNKNVATLNKMMAGRKLNTTAPLAQISEFLSAHRPAIDFAVEHSKGKKVWSAEVRAVVARAYYHIDHQELARFCEVVSTGLYAGDHESGAARLRAFLLDPSPPSAKSADGEAKYVAKGIEKYGKAQRALVAFSLGESITKLTASKHEQFPLPEEMQSDD